MGGGGDPEMWKYFIAIEGPGGTWKDFISIEKVWRGGMWKDFVAINGSECVRALTCIAIDDPGHWEVVEERNYLHSRRLQIAYI